MPLHSDTVVLEKFNAVLKLEHAYVQRVMRTDKAKWGALLPQPLGSVTDIH